MLDAKHMHVVCREASRADDCGRPLNRNVRNCERCAGTGFLEDGPDPHAGYGWCPGCQGLGWYAVVTLGDLLGTIFGGGAFVALVILAMAAAS
jgi:hypothetical protein